MVGLANATLELALAGVPEKDTKRIVSRVADKKDVDISGWLEAFM